MQARTDALGDLEGKGTADLFLEGSGASTPPAPRERRYRGPMQVTATDRAAEVVADMGERRAGVLTITIGTGCCESTAPFLYEDFWPGPDQAPVGEVGGVTVYAPEYLREQYPGDDGVVLDVVEELGESLSIETELSCRLILRGQDFDTSAEPQVCATSLSDGDPVLRPVVGEMPEALRRLRMR